ncbi:AAA family ATPase [Virgibacillus halodenitrificans]|uniref:AAA family ATPase n=1 Tax=Virgibacillus halodenitrificans TaxID=1482 RepID=UPI000EF45975|nr:AAA family ATPase [Virgibacillus halodenitrificans]
MNNIELNQDLLIDNYIENAFKRYLRFKDTPTYDETYKLEILSELNKYFREETITENNIVETIKKIVSNNPQSGSFVHWSNTSDLQDFVKNNPLAAVNLLSSLYENEEVSLQDRIEKFREQGKEWKKDISLGAPLFGYLLAAYNYEKYPLYKEEVFKYTKKMLGIDKKLSGVGKNYQDYYDICVTVKDFLNDRGYSLNMLDIQDFFFCVSQYDILKLESAVEYLYKDAEKLSRFKQDDTVFIEAIKQMDQEILENKRELYRNQEKIRKIRFKILDYYLTNNELTVDDIEHIKEEISSQYDTNILQAWTNFTILFQIYYDSIKEKVKMMLENIRNAMENMKVVTDLGIELDSSLNGFEWKQNFGDTECWLAVYSKELKSHKLAAQLFISISEKGVRFGLDYGSQHERVGKKNMELMDIASFSYQEMEKKIAEVIPEFMENNGSNSEKVPVSLSNTFTSIFNSYEDANWAFDFVKQTMMSLGVSAPGDQRIAVTFRSGRKLHVDFCSWLVTGFVKNKENQTMIRITLPASELNEKVFAEIDPFKMKENEEQIVLASISMEKFREDKELQHMHRNTLEIIKNRYKDQSKSQYRVHNNEQLEQAVFHPNKRESVLQKEIPSNPEELIQLDDFVEIPSLSFDKQITLQGLFFEEKDQLLRQIKTALINQKHIILTGPPGTGKSKLAKEICDAFGADFKMATATSDWSTYETIGGYRPKSDGTLSFNPGLFLDCFKDSNTNQPINKWLIIDEMNRADIDKAFGSLFSALTGDEVMLNFESESGQSISLHPQKEVSEVLPNNHEYVIPNDWRMIGTMNTLDKASLYEMSYAFMRRFAFIPVGVPRNIDSNLVEALLEKWNLASYEYSDYLATIWKKINHYRQIGPAIIEDIARYTSVDADFTSAIILYVLPQFEGLLDHDILSFIEQVCELPVMEDERLRQFAQDFFHVKE